MKSGLVALKYILLVVCYACIGISLDDFVSHADVCNRELCYDLAHFNIQRTTYNTENFATVKHSCDDYCTSLFTRPGSSDTVIIFTTCNHLPHSITALDSISRSTDTFDVIAIDDYSIDGTQDYLRKKGYFVLSSSRPMGLTHSWNVGYRIAKYLAYKYVIFANNDILIPSGAVDALRRDLISEALVVPLTTLKGAGHNPSQNINRAHDISLQFNRYTYDPSNAQTLQNLLTALCDKRENRTIVSESKSGVRFNGFFFAVNLHLIAPAAYDAHHLFDPTTIMVEQEDRLMAKMMLHKLFPKISLCAFVFHFKSVTVKVAQYSSEGNETRENLSLYHPHYGLDNDELPVPRLNIDHILKPTLPKQRLRPILAIAADDTNVVVAQEMGYSLSSQYHVDVTYDALNLDKVDILLSLSPHFLITKIEHAKPTLLVVAWMVNNFDKWISVPWLGNYDVVLVSSTNAEQQMRSIPLQSILYSRAPRQLQDRIASTNILAEILRPAVNVNTVHSSSTGKRSLDFVFVGHIDDAALAMFSTKPKKMSMLRGEIVPWNLQNTPRFLPFNYNNITFRYETSFAALSVLVRSCRVLVVHVDASFYWGEYDALMLEAVAAGTLVLTNDWNAHSLFGDNIPLYSSPADFGEQLLLLLQNKPFRKDIIFRLQRHILKSHTYSQRAADLRYFLRDAGYVLLNRSVHDASLIPLDNMPSLCIGMRVVEEDEKRLMSILQRFLFMHTISSHATHLDLVLHLVLDKTVNRTEVESVVLQLNRRFHRSVVYIFDDPVHLLGKKMTEALHNFNTIDSLFDHHIQMSKCTWSIMTVSNIEYYPNWFDSVAAHILSRQELTVIGWDKHVTYVNAIGGRQATVTRKTALLVDYIDLSCVAIRTSALQSGTARLLPMAMLTPYLEFREVIFLHDILGYYVRKMENEQFLYSGTDISNYFIIGTPLMKKYKTLV